MNFVVALICVGPLLLLFHSTKVHTHPVNLDLNHKWQAGYHPFPEMSRFLNSHSRIHRQSPRPSYSFLGYLCSMADDEKSIQEFLSTFDSKYGSLIMTIIEQDCPAYKRRHRRSINDVNQKDFSRTFLSQIVDYQHKF
ncbi:unnamed protein product [Rotaria magnacalcarata]|nr:unnamed protein product [Rotaria magnacalcarata]CAF1683097.1 unnamed protein product [Rotaria magnacalcarata]CAF2027575.1 unnamed protein product [Rotaria magnacalcarata]CAF2055371.1 unnamed protein product [Rotaria magnacalcarata]CAF2145869.1 unnamed protein product [Rotaria magnacalcarata]